MSGRRRALAVAAAAGMLTVVGAAVGLGTTPTQAEPIQAEPQQLPPTTTIVPATNVVPAPAPPPPAPTTTVPPASTTSTTQARSTTLIPIPAGCSSPAPAAVVFVGQMVDMGEDDGMARFELRQVRAGETGGRERNGLVDVHYGADLRFLAIGSQYLVGAGIDDDTGGLMSKVRTEEPLFGGNDIVDVGETDVECPQLEDPVRTLTVTGRSIDSGVLSPLGRSRSRLARAILVPAGIAVGAIVALSVLRWLLTGLARGTSVAVDASRATTRRNRYR